MRMPATEWKKCDRCRGEGENPYVLGIVCPACQGGGYLLVVVEYSHGVKTFKGLAPLPLVKVGKL